MHNPDQEQIFSTGDIVFQTRLSDGATFIDKLGNVITARMTSQGKLYFTDTTGPHIDFALFFQPCLRNFNTTPLSTFYGFSLISTQTTLNKTPFEILNSPELFKPLSKRLTLAASILEIVPNKLPNSYSKLRGKFPLSLVHDLVEFCQNPNFQIESLESIYGLGPESYKQESDHLANMICHEFYIEQRLMEILTDLSK